jgi:hypothetical protein
MATIKGKGSNTPEDTGTQQALGRKATQFKPGESGNPKGRPKGARNRLGTKFLEALEADFNKHGAQAIEQVRQKKRFEEAGWSPDEPSQAGFWDRLCL